MMLLELISEEHLTFFADQVLVLSYQLLEDLCDLITLYLPI